MLNDPNKYLEGKFEELLTEAKKVKKWSKKVETKWDAPEGFFTSSASKIANGLKRAHKDLKSAMGSLNFYINRQGKNLSAEDKSRLESSKDKLKGLYESVQSDKFISESVQESKSINLESYRYQSLADRLLLDE